VKRAQRVARGLAIAGTALLLLVFAAVLVTIPGSVPHEVGIFGLLAVAAMDFSTVVLTAGCLLLVAAVLTRSHRAVVGAGLAAAVVSIAAGILWSPTVPSGAGDSSLATWLIAVYWLGAILACLAGVSLVHALVIRRPGDRPSTAPG
jgi:hypothetical protein